MTRRDPPKMISIAVSRPSRPPTDLEVMDRQSMTIQDLRSDLRSARAQLRWSRFMLALVIVLWGAMNVARSLGWL